MPSMAVRIGTGVIFAALLSSVTACSRGPASRRDLTKAIVEAMGERPAIGCSAPFFEDVPCSDSGWGWIERIRTDGITKGCNPNRHLFCPNDPVSRATVAMFAARALAKGDDGVPEAYGPEATTGRRYSCDPASLNVSFRDVSAGDIFCRHVHYLWARGVTTGFSDGSYRPTVLATRSNVDDLVSQVVRARASSR